MVDSEILYIFTLLNLKRNDMEKQEIGLTENNLKKLDEIENEILDFDDLDDRMDYVDELCLFSVFPDDLTNEQEDMIDEYLRDFVMDTM